MKGTARHHRRRANTRLIAALAVAGVLGAGALGAVGLLLWPRWPAGAPVAGAPALPITIAGVAFNVPPAAIRFPPQRRAGAQPRLDLAFEWPDLTPPKPPQRLVLSADASAVHHLFISVAAAQTALPLEQRIRTIYPRYLAPAAFDGPPGLNGVAFRDGTPYQGEDLLFDAQRPEQFLVRCTRSLPATPGTCLMERRLGEAELTVRFPREWLADWPQLVAGVDRLLTQLR